MVGKQHFRSGAIALFIVMVIGSGGGLLVQLVIARLLGAEQYGLYSYALSWLSIVVILCLFGFNSSAPRFVAAYLATGQTELLNSYLKFCTRVVLVVSLMLALVTTSVTYYFSERLNTATVHLVYASCLMLVPHTLLVLWSGQLQGLGQIVVAQIYDRIARPIIFVTVLLLFFAFTTGEITAQTTLYINGAAYTIAALLATLRIRRSVLSRLEAKKSTAKPEQREWVAVSLRMAMHAVLALVLSQTDIVMLGAMTDTTESGKYTVAARLASLILFGIVAVGKVSAPKIAGLHATKSHDELQLLVRRSARGLFVITFTLAIGMVLSRKLLLGAFGVEFLEAETALLFIIAGTCVHGLVGMVGPLTTMTGLEKEAMFFMAFSAMLNIVLNSLFIPLWGMNGAAAATSLCMASWLVPLYFVVRKRLNIRPSIF